MKDINQLLIEAQKLTNSISFTVEVVTPEIAIKYLNTSIGNRNIKKDTITALVNALTKGTFAMIKNKVGINTLGARNKLPGLFTIKEVGI